MLYRQSFKERQKPEVNNPQDFPGGLVVKNLPASTGMWVQSLGREDFLEKEMATHPSILAQKIPWTEEPGRLQSMGSQSWTCLAIEQQYPHSSIHPGFWRHFKNVLIFQTLNPQSTLAICILF